VLAARSTRGAHEDRSSLDLGPPPGFEGLHVVAGFAMMETDRTSYGGTKLMQKPRDATDVLEHDFLETRCKILEIAATLDRIDRAPARHGEHPDARLGQLRRGLEALLEPGPGRAETVQHIFSLDYDRDWRKKMNVNGPRSNSHS
jgi:hypothetical protein